MWGDFQYITPFRSDRQNNSADRRPEGILRKSIKLFLLLCEYVTDDIVTLAIALMWNRFLSYSRRRICYEQYDAIPGLFRFNSL